MADSVVQRRACSLRRGVRWFGAAGWQVMAMVLLAAGSVAGAEPIRLSSLAIEPAPSRANLLANSGFEETKPNGMPAGWSWDRRNTDAVCEIDRTQLHRGRQCLRLTNGTAFGAHVYGMLWISRPVRLMEGKPYTMSAWIKSDKPGIMSLVGGADWQFRVTASNTDGQWHRISKTFTPEAKDRDFTLRINTESVTPGVWIDDVKLEEGTTPTLDPPVEGDKIGASLEADEAETVVQGDGPFGVVFTLSSSRPLAANLIATFNGGASLRQPVNVAPGVWRVRVKGESASADDAPRSLSLRLEQDGKDAGTATSRVRFFSANNALLRLAELRKQLPALKADLTSVKSAGQDTSYPAVAFRVLDDFINYAGEDARRGEVQRSLEQVGEMEKMATRLGGELKESLEGKRRFPAVPRWTGAQRPTIRSSSFMAQARMPGGATTERPIFFTGFGHFGQVVADMEKWPDYGVNIIQIELGPSRVFPSEGRTDDAPAQEMLRTLDRAQRSGVAVCLLISPHYFPDWALKKWPHLRKHREGFLQFCLHAPEGRDLLRRFVLSTLAPLKDHPALHSICLTNEPVNQEEPCEPATKAWHAWLEKHHGNIATLNARYQTAFAAFDAVPLPDPFAKRPAQPVWMDYIRFNQEFFADWHRMLADAVHEVAPALPVHAKTMTWTLLNDTDIKYGVDATLFARLSQINGNDSANMFNFGDGEFAQHWEMNAMAHDLQRSVLDAPVLNSENHIITDRDTRPVPPAHIRAALWQAAVHGQSATAIWVWERTFDHRSDAAGSIMHRPACAQAVGIVNHDLNRAAFEVTAIQQARPQALLLQSVTASVWDGGYTNCMHTLYTALSFTGLKLGFVTERQLESGEVPDAPVVFVPGVVHFSQAAMAGLKKFKGRVVLVGDAGTLTQNEYGRATLPRIDADTLAFRHGTTSARELHTQILAKLPEWKLQPAVDLRGVDHQPVWGVEWRSGDGRDGLVVNLCNYLKQPATVSLTRAGRPVVARDILSGDRVEGPFTLSSLEVRLLRLEDPAKGRK